MAEGGGKGRATGLRLSVDSRGRGLIVLRPLKYKCPQWEEEGQGQSSLFGHTCLFPRVGLMQGRWPAAQRGMDTGEGPRPGPRASLEVTVTEQHGQWRFTLKGHVPTPLQGPQVP